MAYIFVNSPVWTAPDFHDNGSMETGPLLLNYCVTGRCELILNNGNFVYVKDGEISLTERFARQQYVYPRRIYEGIEFFVDMDTVNAQSSWVEVNLILISTDSEIFTARMGVLILRRLRLR